MEKQKSVEDYLESILMITKENGSCRSIDVARKLGFTKASVSIAVKKLSEEGYVIKEDKGNLVLTDAGLEYASRVYERHEVLKSFLVNMGVSEKVAEEDACEMEHIISEITFQKIKEWNLKSA
ncbi:MAG: metal-dependent transcriptional regulator [Faecalicoccus sp.]|nr:metal-dependent transcriptional regulator [Faecalicoccus sp.]